MNPWSRAENRGDEADERALFERRARALPPAEVPALADVLRAADEAEDTVRARRNAVMGGLMAAACLAAALTALPGGSSHRGRGAIAPDLAATGGVEASVGPTEEAAMCVEETPCASLEPKASPCSESSVGSARLAAFDDAITCSVVEPWGQPQSVPSRAPCPAETSCALAGP